LEEEVANIIGELTTQGFRGMIQLSEMEEDYNAMFTDFVTQYNKIPRHGQEIKSKSIAGSYAFDFSFLIDPLGLYYGNTTTGGAVVFNHTHMDHTRLSYNMLLCGVPGSGKSTTLKKIAVARVILGEQVFIFAVSNEFNLLSRTLGGVAENIAECSTNLLQVFATCVDENTLEVQTEASFDSHLAKVVLIYRFLMDETVPTVERELKAQLRKFYEYWCSSKGSSMKEITSLQASDYPLMEDFLEFLLHELYEDQEERTYYAKWKINEIQILEQLISNVNSIIINDPLFN
ncbi:hypothetical protein NY18_15945, partial [Listeria monocytogenes]|nr:hypothetical protein [Listeria monocytogenes]